MWLPGLLSFLSHSTDVFICTSPIKMYKYCPYEKVSCVLACREGLVICSPHFTPRVISKGCQLSTCPTRRALNPYTAAAGWGGFVSASSPIDPSCFCARVSFPDNLP